MDSLGIANDPSRRSVNTRAFISINLPPLARVDRRGSTLLLSLANRATGVFSYKLNRLSFQRRQGLS